MAIQAKTGRSYTLIQRVLNTVGAKRRKHRHANTMGTLNMEGAA